MRKVQYFVEFGDGSDWTLSKYLTHANRTFNNLIKVKEKVETSTVFFSYSKSSDFFCFFLFQKKKD